MEKLLRTGEYLNLNNDKITRDFDFLKSALYFDAGNYWFEDNQTNIGIVTFKGTKFNIALLLLIKSIVVRGRSINCTISIP